MLYLRKKKKQTNVINARPFIKGLRYLPLKYAFGWVFPALQDDIAYMSWFIYFVFILEFRRGKLFIIGLVIFLLLSVNIHVYTTQWICILEVKEYL